jgi:mannose/cellobiose epimerase-like protein (N-acyl-D-glucosamine 2-epimerase family)
MSTLESLRARLAEWLVAAAYPLWASHGLDSRDGTFAEALDQDGRPLPQPRRARVPPRQVYAFALAGEFGWRGDVSGIVSRGLDYFTTTFQRADGLFRTMTDADGVPLDEHALLYDQAFALLGLAAAAEALNARAQFETRALQLRRLIEQRFGAADGSYNADETPGGTRESNPHMHLLEAYLAWAEIGEDPGWAEGIRGIVGLAVSRFIRKHTGVLGESYLASWQPTPGIAGRIVEPGHNFEWAWLLLRCERWSPDPLRDTALRLMAVSEQYGVRNGVAVNALDNDLSLTDANARLWPQTERLKAALLAATLTGESRYWAMAEAAARSFVPYLNTRVPGLWLDIQMPNGTLLDSPSPASTFYHLVGAIRALQVAARAM